MRILLIEDDVILSQELCKLMEGYNIHIDKADCGDAGLELADLYEYQAITLDLGLPDMNGSEVLSRLRKAGNCLPILILSGDSSLNARLSCLQNGADDFLIKPFASQELVTRLQALVRRTNGHAVNVLTFGDVALDIEARDLRVGKQRVKLTAKEYEMLELLFLKRGGIVSKESFLDHLYGGLDEPEAKIIDVFICKLRKKLDAAGSHLPVIETVWGRGYRVNTEDCLTANGF